MKHALKYLIGIGLLAIQANLSLATQSTRTHASQKTSHHKKSKKNKPNATISDTKPHLITVTKLSDIPAVYRNTPIESLLAYHNLGKPLNPYTSAQLLIGMCMDNRKNLTLPDNFAFVLRTAGANLRFSEFAISYAIAIGGIKGIALIGHNHCAMVNLAARKEKFIEGLITYAGWNYQQALDQFMHFAPLFEIGNEIDFIAFEAKRLRARYPKIPIAPLLYKIEDNRLYFIGE